MCSKRPLAIFRTILSPKPFISSSLDGSSSRTRARPSRNAHYGLGLRRPMPGIMPEARYFSMPFLVLGSVYPPPPRQAACRRSDGRSIPHEHDQLPCLGGGELARRGHFRLRPVHLSLTTVNRFSSFLKVTAGLSLLSSPWHHRGNEKAARRPSRPGRLSSSLSQPFRGVRGFPRSMLRLRPKWP